MNRYSARHPSLRHVPREGSVLDRLGHVCREALGERDRLRERLLGEHVLERRADGRERERVAGQRAADPARVLVVGLGARR